MYPSPLPKYQQLSDILRQKIVSGTFIAGSRLPTEFSLCEEYQVSRGTVRKAYDILDKDGLIRREQGSGIFVAEPSPKPNQFNLIENRNFKTETLTKELIKSNDMLSEKLSVPIDTSVIHLIQLQHDNGQASIYEERYLAEHLCPDLMNDDLEKESIHTLLIEKYSLSLVKLSHTIVIRKIYPDTAQLLGVKNGEQGFFVDRLSYTKSDEGIIPAVWYQAIYRQDDFHFQAAFQSSI